MPITNYDIESRVAKGNFVPHLFLTNLAISYFQDMRNFISTRVFPIVPVSLSRSFFYEFDRGDLARDNVSQKPEGGHVTPALIGRRDNDYRCVPDQILVAEDQLYTADYRRLNIPLVGDPNEMYARFIAQQLHIHMDRKWAGKYFNAASWDTVYTGTDTTPTAGQVWFFDNENGDPVDMITKMRLAILMSGTMEPNKLVLGAQAYAALLSHPAVLDRIKYQGSASSPAAVTEATLAALFGLDEVIVAKSAVNLSNPHEPDDIQFICDPKSALLCYTTNGPSITTPSAGYTFAWDMGVGSYIATMKYPGNVKDHTAWAEGLVSIDPQVVAPSLGIFLDNIVSPNFALLPA